MRQDGKPFGGGPRSVTAIGGDGSAGDPEVGENNRVRAQGTETHSHHGTHLLDSSHVVVTLGG
ncbi:hypothetical protein GCM10027168_21840 [Streptomyces capparidis]